MPPAQASDGVSAILDPAVKLPLTSAVDAALPAPLPLLAHAKHVVDALVEGSATTVREAVQ